MIKKLDGGH